MIANLVSALALVVASTAVAQEPATTPDETLARLLNLDVRTKADVSHRNEQIRAWLADHDSELAGDSILREIAGYHLDGKEHVDEHASAIWRRVQDDGFAFDALREDVGRILMFHGCTLGDHGEFEACTPLVPKAIELGADPKSIYWLIGRRARDAKTEAGTGYLQHVVVPWILTEHRLTDDERVFVLRHLYDVEYDGPRPFVHFSGRTIDGQTVSTHDYAGQVLLVDFWATWCVPCRQALPDIAKAREEFGDRGFEVLGVSIDDAGLADKVREVANAGGATWPQIYEGLGGRQRIATENHVFEIPGLFLLDRAGRCRYTNLHGDELRKRIEELLAEKP